MNKWSANKLVRQFCCQNEVPYSQLVKKIPPEILEAALIGSEDNKPLIAIKVSDSPPLYHAGEIVIPRIKNGNLRKNDLFKLTDYGKDVLYQMQWDYMHFVLALTAAVCGIIGVIKLL